MVTAKQAAEARAALAKKTAAKTPPRRRRPQPEETSPTKAAAVAPASGGCASGFARFLQCLLQLASFAAVGGAAYFVYADGGLRVLLRLAPEESEEQADVCRVPAQFDMQGTPTWYITGCAWAWAYPGAALVLALTSVWLLCKPPNTTALYMTALLASSNAFIALITWQLHDLGEEMHDSDTEVATLEPPYAVPAFLALEGALTLLYLFALVIGACCCKAKPAVVAPGAAPPSAARRAAAAKEMR